MTALWGSLRLGVHLLASLLFLHQTGCLYPTATAVYADFPPDLYSGNRHNHHHLHVSSRETQGYYYEPYLVSDDGGDDNEDESEISEPIDQDEDLERMLMVEDGNGEKVRRSDNEIIIQDFISLSSSKVLMKVKESDGVTVKINNIGDKQNDDTDVNDRSHHDDILHGGDSSIGDDVIISEEEQLKRLEKKFLSLFGMKSRPKRKKGMIKGKGSVPKELLNLFEKQSGGEFQTTDLFLPGKLTRNANTVRVINPLEIIHLDGMSSFHAIIKFDFFSSSIPANEKVTGAELRVPFSITVPSTQEPLSTDISSPSVFARVLLHDIVKPQNTDSRHSKDTLFVKPITHVIDSKLVNLTNRKYPTFWLTFDILPAVLRWIGSSSATGGSKGNHTSVTSGNNYGVALEIVGLKGEKHKEIKGGQIFNMKIKTDKDTSSLFVYSDDGHNNNNNARKTRRSKREAKTNTHKSIQRKLRRAAQLHHQYHHQQQYYRNHNQHHYHHHYGGGGRRRKPHRYKNRRRNLCSKKPMFVDFTDVGWNDWIVAPPGYQAYYCSGECPFPMAEHLNATNHAVIQALINSLNPSLVPPPCCVPDKYSSLSLLYTDSSDRIVLKNYNEMVVDSCGCS